MNIKTIASAVLAAVVLCAAPAFADGKMNLNTATEQELSANPAVGPELAGDSVEALADTLARAERKALLAALQACGGNRRLAASRLGISRAGFYAKLQQHGIQR